jgi:hypothetical protein
MSIYLNFFIKATRLFPVPGDVNLIVLGMHYVLSGEESGNRTPNAAYTAHAQTGRDVISLDFAGISAPRCDWD